MGAASFCLSLMVMKQLGSSAKDKADSLTAASCTFVFTWFFTPPARPKNY